MNGSVLFDTETRTWHLFRSRIFSGNKSTLFASKLPFLNSLICIGVVLPQVPSLNGMKVSTEVELKSFSNKTTTLNICLIHRSLKISSVSSIFPSIRTTTKNPFILKSSAEILLKISKKSSNFCIKIMLLRRNLFVAKLSDVSRRNPNFNF